MLTMEGVQGVNDKALGGAMLLVASVVFTYYTTWAILLVS
jgi:dolichyl-phosphate mannosyltransferase polypeptide 2 regulatory subunit